MDTYSFLRQLADSWVLLAMFSFFVGVILWAFRPGSSDTYAAVARIPLREDAPAACRGCNGADCAAKKGARND
ncbi:MAG: cbb3-type cytochrome c oxidase subunit 3 [Sulfitobacter litoralis]|jgi:cytochrome c oxidase cbb3-type subunit 4|uniref:Cbb3-type cytochrome c oxidase subunit 3 n=2 Tax=root TaxID=1 RepID=A0A1H0UFQ1_9RHOB|nr:MULTISPECIES: cbb3-type cytochrome c oxidase subunit 3 [Sulfitobacter]MBQ0717877.1 cbb3-type cytochrome c oxidase subunit 3 [Sulfitobacter litoralis]MBQ0765349.1 cbb3-type cytochrome c oxidase subunit 3 [Sulfitobacter litoralis]MBQ0800884.1 cbb3-type cytochrome c oxidase subunit 3 [Sulfitobacter litoralis]MCF7726569.1 CcoQ/FixQ family Cbb3-type cytochrome c oxidase assembly chaperone [Sulfitobacter sp. M22]MCF7777911.1 CcoQ/FixQ family Cbb3-type cytochrome c oxidase assembly chaperone [Sulf|tara:strand:+ start:158 stop:376 length:219 start_codon:yes stop_codon:yes gene_type:complete